MLFHTEETTLFCMYCQKETPHEVDYVNETISSIECHICHNKLSIDVDAMEEFHEYIYERLKTKTGRLSEEAQQDLSKFLASMPLRIISKPIRFGSEYKQLNQEVKKYIEETQKEHEEEEQDD